MTALQLLRTGLGLLAASLLITVVMSSVAGGGANSVTGFALAGWATQAGLSVGSLMTVAGLVLRGLQPSGRPDEEPAVDHYR